MIRVKGYTFDAHRPPVSYECDFNMTTITEFQDFLKEKSLSIICLFGKKIKKD